jgi:hypothetical protein
MATSTASLRDAESKGLRNSRGLAPWGFRNPRPAGLVLGMFADRMPIADPIGRIKKLADSRSTDTRTVMASRLPSENSCRFCANLKSWLDVSAWCCEVPSQLRQRVAAPRGTRWCLASSAEIGRGVIVVRVDEQLTCQSSRFRLSRNSRRLQKPIKNCLRGAGKKVHIIVGTLIALIHKKTWLRLSVRRYESQVRLVAVVHWPA